VNITKGFVTCRNPETGEAKWFPKDDVPPGWVNPMTGLAVCRNLETGETKNFPKSDIPPGWVSAVQRLFFTNPSLPSGWFVPGKEPEGYVVDKSVIPMAVISASVFSKIAELKAVGVTVKAPHPKISATRYARWVKFLADLDKLKPPGA
jgi:hypothetical protein